jgi:hypothetical protein
MSSKPSLTDLRAFAEAGIMPLDEYLEAAERDKADIRRKIHALAARVNRMHGRPPLRLVELPDNASEGEV